MHKVMCRLCKQYFDTETEEAVVIGQKSYYHKTCYDEWKSERSGPNGHMSEDFWYEAMIDYLYRDVKLGGMDFPKIMSQWKSFTGPKHSFTPKGIYFAIRYFYDVQHGDADKALGGIGIVPSIYNQSAQYWIERENKKVGTLEAIIEQIKQREVRPIREIKRFEKKKPEPKFSLDDI